MAAAVRAEVDVSAAPVDTPAVFRCEPCGCALTPAACGARFRRVEAGKPTPSSLGSRDQIAGGACRGCPVGAAHALGGHPSHWPNGNRVVRASDPAGLGYNAHPVDRTGTCVGGRRSLRIAPAEPLEQRHRERPQRIVDCACGRKYVHNGKSRMCRACSNAAQRKRLVARARAKFGGGSHTTGPEQEASR